VEEGDREGAGRRRARNASWKRDESGRGEGGRGEEMGGGARSLGRQSLWEDTETDEEGGGWGGGRERREGGGGGEERREESREAGSARGESEEGCVLAPRAGAAFGMEGGGVVGSGAGRGGGQGGGGGREEVGSGRTAGCGVRGSERGR